MLKGLIARICEVSWHVLKSQGFLFEFLHISALLYSGENEYLPVIQLLVKEGQSTVRCTRHLTFMQSPKSIAP